MIFFIQLGKLYQDAMYSLCKRIIDQEDVPKSFRKTTLYMIWKRKGSMDILKNNRFLHMKGVLARTVDALVVEKLKEPLVNSATIQHIGGLPGHSISEHLITLNTNYGMGRIKEDRDYIPNEHHIVLLTRKTSLIAWRLWKGWG